MEDDHLVDIAEELKWAEASRDFKKNSNVSQCNYQLVAWITPQYDLATYLRAIGSCLASTISTQGDSTLSRFALIESPLDESSLDNCLSFAEIEGPLMVSYVTISKAVMVDETDNEIKYIKTNPLTIEQTSTIRVKQEDGDSESWDINLLDSSGDEIGANQLVHMEQEKEGEAKQELLGISEDQDGSILGIMQFTNYAPPSPSSGQTVDQEEQDLDNQIPEELQLVDADFNNIALT